MFYDLETTKFRRKVTCITQPNITIYKTYNGYKNIVI